MKLAKANRIGMIGKVLSETENDYLIHFGGTLGSAESKESCTILEVGEFNDTGVDSWYKAFKQKENESN